MKDIKLIIFDIGNVIIGFDHMIACNKLAKVSDYNAGEIYNLIFGNTLVDKFERGKLCPKYFYQKICEKLNTDIKFSQFYNIWGDIFYLNEDIDKIILNLKKQVKIFALSNTDPLHFKFFRNKFDIFNNIEKFILSFEVGYKKPEKRIYKETLGYAKLPAEKTLLIDDLKQNIGAFRAMGGNGIIFKNTSSLKRELKKYNINP